MFTLLLVFGVQRVLAFESEVIHATEEIQVIGTHLLYLEDVNRDFTIAQAWEKRERGLFDTHDKEFFNRPNSTSSYWFSFSVLTDLEDIWINVSNNNLDSVHFYMLDDNGVVIRETLTGSILNKDTREFAADTYWFRITDEPDTTVKHVFLKVYSSMSMEIPIELGSFDSLLNSKFVNDLFAHVFIGGLLVMFFYNLVLYIIIREKVYVYYLMYILGSIFASTLINNYPLIELIVGQKFAHLNVTSWIWVSFVGVILFTIEYLQLKENRRFIYYLLRVFILVLLVFALIEIVLPSWEISNTYQAFVPIVFLTCLYSAYSLSFAGDKKARLYALGWTVLMSSSIIYLLVTNGFLPYNTLTRNITYIGILIEIVIFSIALAHRITILKEEQEKLNAALLQKNNELIISNESLDSFNYHVSHDLKSVLNNTTILSKMIKKYLNKGNTDKVSEITDKLQLVAANGVETVQSFLSLGKIDNILNSSERVEIDLELSIKDLLVNYDLIDKVKITIDNTEGLKLSMHPKAFESILLNLITNSIKYSDVFPEVVLTLSSIHAGIKMIFTDNGIGIDLEKNRSKVFEPFVRINNTKNAEGSGVGLFLVKKIVNANNGSIEIESKLGEGTTFILKFEN